MGTGVCLFLVSSFYNFFCLVRYVLDDHTRLFSPRSTLVLYRIYSVSQKVIPLNVWLWQVQTCIALHIIKRTQASMNLEYCHQILYKSIVPFSRFSIFTKCCQKVELPAAQLTCFLCTLTVFCVNVQHFASNGVHWNFIFSAYQALNFIDWL